jgi:hypothetical protein
VDTQFFDDILSALPRIITKDQHDGSDDPATVCQNGTCSTTDAVSDMDVVRQIPQQSTCPLSTAAARSLGSRHKLPCLEGEIAFSVRLGSVLRPNGCIEISKARQLDGQMRCLAKTGHLTLFLRSPYSLSLSVTTTQKQRSRPSRSATWEHGLATSGWFNSGGLVFAGSGWECRRAISADDLVAGGRPGGARGLAAKTLAAKAPPSPARARDGE